MSANQSPSVSAIVPCRNEIRHIEVCLQSILSQVPPPGGLEIIVVDGMSDDGTAEVLKRMSKENASIRVFDNPNRITSCGMNIGIKAARGEFVAILGAHTQYAPDYLATSVQLLEEHPEACCAGGPIISNARSRFGQAVAQAMSHPVGIGNAKHRYANYEGYAEGACFPVFRKEIFDKIGFYDETLVRNQDDELNYRIARTGGKVFISPRANCTYYVRETPWQLFRQYFQYGYWRVAVLKKHQIPASIRQIVPVIFFPLVLGFLVVGLFLPDWWKLLGAAPAIGYLFILGCSGIGVAIKNDMASGCLFPIAAIIMHVAYGAGFAANLLHFKNT